MDIKHIIAPGIFPHLANGFQEGLALNVAHRAAYFHDYHFRAALPSYRADTRFKWWSRLRRNIAAKEWLFNPFFYAVLFFLAITIALRPTVSARSATWPLLLLLCFEGASTFAVASLNDYVETSRHIILFQVCTDLLFVLLVMEATGAIFGRRPGIGRQSRVGAVDQAGVRV